MTAATGGTGILAITAAIIGFGVISQLVADRFRVPSLIFLIAAGIFLGPLPAALQEVPWVADHLPWLAPIIRAEAFGGALSGIVGLAVAIIVFEGAFHLKIERLREAPSASFRLVTVGAAAMFVGTMATVHYLLGAPWLLSALIGALLVATGPTVITPILQVVPVRDRVGAILETEGIVNDVTAAIAAVVVFEAIVTDTTAWSELLRLFAERLGIGLLVGAVVAGVLYYLLQYVDLSPGNAPQNARLLVLAGAIVAFAGADLIASEAGVAAVATAGVLLGNADVPYERDIEDFKGDITLLVLSFVFIALAGLLDFAILVELGLWGLLLVAILALVIRPLLVFGSMRGDRFTVQEKLFVSVVGPRGIIPASVATLFAVELEAADPGALAIAAPAEAANTLVGVVFLTIMLTVAFEGGFARQIAEYLNVIPMRVIIVGGGTAGRSLADRLEDRGENIVLVEKDQKMVERARNDGFTVHKGDGTDTEVLRSAGAENTKVLVAATGDDDVNLLVAQLADSKFDVGNIIARANNPDNVEAFEDLGVRTISTTDAIAWAMDNAIERPALAEWMTQIGRKGDAQEVEVTSEDIAGRSIREVGPELPGNCLIALVTRDGETMMPDAEFVLEYGDHVTILGRREDVREAMAVCDPDG